MGIFDWLATLIPKDTESTSDTGASESGSLMHSKDRKKVEDVVKKSTQAEKAAAFQQAFNQNNIELMAMLTGVGGYKPSPEMKNDKGVPLKQWLAEQARGGDDTARNLAAQIDRKLDGPTLSLTAKGISLVNAIQIEANTWSLGNSLQNSIGLVPALQRTPSAARAF